MGAETVPPKLKADLSDRALAALEMVLEGLDYAGNVSRSGIAGAIDKDGSAMDWMDEAARGKRKTSGGNLKDTTTKRLLGKEKMRFGVDGDGETTWGDVADVGLDTAIEIGTDPLTLLGAGFLNRGKLGKVLHAGEAGMAGPKGGKNVLKEALELAGRGAGNIPEPMTPAAAEVITGKMLGLKGEVLDEGADRYARKMAEAKGIGLEPPAEPVMKLKDIGKPPSGEALAKKIEAMGYETIPDSSKGAAKSLAKAEKAISKIPAEASLADAERIASRLVNPMDTIGEYGHEVFEKAPEMLGPDKPGMLRKLLSLATDNPKTSILTAGGLGTGAYNHITKPKTDGFRTSPRGKVKFSKGDGGKEMPVISEKDIKIVRKFSPALAKELEAMGAYNKENLAAQEESLKKVEPFIRKWTSM